MQLSSGRISALLLRYLPGRVAPSVDTRFSRMVNVTFAMALQAVGRVLLTHGRVRLAQLIPLLPKPLPHVQVKKALIVLLQHGLAKTTAVEERRRPVAGAQAAGASAVEGPASAAAADGAGAAAGAVV